MGVSPEAISGSFRSETFEAIFYPDTYKRQKTITPRFFLKKAKGADSFPTFYGPMTKGKLGEPEVHVKCFPKIFLTIPHRVPFLPSPWREQYLPAPSQ
jgi:hypothetical protein